jgi:hypothetical protein
VLTCCIRVQSLTASPASLGGDGTPPKESMRRTLCVLFLFLGLVGPVLGQNTWQDVGTPQANNYPGYLTTHSCCWDGDITNSASCFSLGGCTGGYASCHSIWLTTAGGFLEDFKDTGCSSLNSRMIVHEQFFTPSDCYSCGNNCACKGYSGINQDGCRRVRILECLPPGFGGGGPGGPCVDECPKGATRCITSTILEYCANAGCPTEGTEWTTGSQYDCKPDRPCREADTCNVFTDSCEEGALKPAGTVCLGGVCNGVDDICGSGPPGCTDSCTPGTPV